MSLFKKQQLKAEYPEQTIEWIEYDRFKMLNIWPYLDNHRTSSRLKSYSLLIWEIVEIYKVQILVYSTHCRNELYTIISIESSANNL
jgi:hypothetical protein